jgi:nucleoporin GLE1
MVAYYTKLQETLAHVCSSVKSFAGSKDPTVKKYRFDLQKAVNTTINSISASSGESLIDKISKLRALIGGQSLDVMGKSVSVSQHPEARLYCCNLLAQKLVVSIFSRP